MGGDGVDKELDTQQLIDLLAKFDKLKKIKRQTFVSEREIRENDAEHSWHTMMWFLLLSDRFDGDVDVEKILIMLLIHDLPEIYAGDKLIFKKTREDEEKEFQSAVQIFSEFPQPLGKRLFKIWHEFEEEETEEAKIAQAMDKAQPMLQNVLTSGRAWRRNSVTVGQVEDHKKRYMKFNATLYSIYENLMKKARRYLK